MNSETLLNAVIFFFGLSKTEAKAYIKQASEETKTELREILKAKLEILDGLKKGSPLFLNGDNDKLSTVKNDDYKVDEDNDIITFNDEIIFVRAQLKVFQKKGLALHLVLNLKRLLLFLLNLYFG